MTGKMKARLVCVQKLLEQLGNARDIEPDGGEYEAETVRLLVDVMDTIAREYNDEQRKKQQAQNEQQA